MFRSSPPHQSAMSRNSFALFVISTAFSALFLPACDKSPKAKTKWTPPAEKKISTATPESQFSDARAKIAAGKAAEAAEVLRALDAKGTAPVSLQPWITLYAGLAELLAGRETESRPLFAKLAERAAAMGQEGQGKLPQFFADISKRLGGEEPVPIAVASSYNKFNYEVLALFLYGLKNENVGAFDDALAFYRQFTTLSAQGPEPWIGLNSQLLSFRQHANNLLEYEDLVDSATRVKASGDRERAQRALEAALTARDRVKLEGKLVASLDERLGEKRQMKAADDKVDSDAFPPAKEKYDALMAQNEFAAAKAAITEPKLKSTKLQREQEMLGSRAGYLEQFKFYLVLELSAVGYAKPITLKNGQTISSGIAKCDDKMIYLRGKEDAKPVPWSDVLPESIYTIAKSLINPSEAEDAAAFRKWHLGNYAAHIGKMEDARALMTDAAKANPDYAPELPLLLGEKAG